MLSVTAPSGEGAFESLANVAQHARAKALKKRRSDVVEVDAMSAEAIAVAEKTWDLCDRLEVALTRVANTRIAPPQAVRSGKGGKASAAAAAAASADARSELLLQLLAVGMEAANAMHVFILRGKPKVVPGSTTTAAHSYGKLDRQQHISRAMARLVVVMRAVCARIGWETQRALIHDGSYAFAVERELREGGYIVFAPNPKEARSHQDIVERYLSCVDFIVATAHAVGLGWWAGADVFQHVLGFRTMGDTSDVFCQRIMRIPMLSVDCAKSAVSGTLVSADGQALGNKPSQALASARSGHGLRSMPARPFQAMFDLWDAEAVARSETPTPAHAVKPPVAAKKKK